MPAIGIFDTGIFDTGIFDHSAEAVTVRAPSYGHWRKTKDRNKPKAPELPAPLEAGEVVVDEAVLQQIEQEQFPKIVRFKSDAVERYRAEREAMLNARRPVKAVTPDPGRFDVVVASPEIRRKIVKPLAEQPDPAPAEPIRGAVTLGRLGARRLAKPALANAGAVMLRTASNRSTQTGW